MTEIFSLSEAGGHAETQDSFAVRPHPNDKECYVCVVADGQGGQPGGGPAARLACMRCIETALSSSLDDLLRPSTWTTLLRRVDEAVASDAASGFTTLAAFCLTKTDICGASSGDSAVLLLDKGSRANPLTARQHKNPPVGSAVAVFIPFAASLTAPWTVLAMSDGVWKYAGWDSVVAMAELQHGRDIIPGLRDRAALRETGGLQDDFTLIVLRTPDA